MMELKNYLRDGADHQARAVLMYLQAIANIEDSYNEEFCRYDATLNVARWENGREQGYVVSMYSHKLSPSKQLNIAFFEHRNSDDICAVEWEQTSINSLTIDTAKFGDIYKDKSDVSHEVSVGEASQMADWIMERFDAFWKENSVYPK